VSALTQATRVVGAGEAARRLLRVLRLEVLAGPDAGRVVRVDRPLFRIGSHASNELVLSDDTVSRHHLELRAEPDGWRVVDLASANGTRLGPLKLGAVHVTGELVLTLGRTRLALEPEEAEAELATSTRTRFGLIAGQAPAMRELFATLERVAAREVALLLEGETGVGKERVAESVHRESPRGGAPFVVVDCAALSGGLAESELFGHVRGAFTGASRDRVGLIELAHGGTLFLDEVAELPLTLQARLTGALERKRVTPIGASTPRAADVRLIAATRRDLARAANEGLFRAELYHRIAGVRVRVPPLRERLDDLPLLVGEMLAELRAREGDAIPEELSAVAIARLAAQLWPGNLRELRNTVEEVALRAAARQPSASVGPEPYLAARDRFLEEFERGWVQAALQASDGNLSEAARRGGLDRRSLQRLAQRHRVR
jgi:DNA-binding NtrC family response regulator